MNTGRAMHAQVEPGEERRRAQGGYLEPLMTAPAEHAYHNELDRKGWTAATLYA